MMISPPIYYFLMLVYKTFLLFPSTFTQSSKNHQLAPLIDKITTKLLC